MLAEVIEKPLLGQNAGLGEAIPAFRDSNHDMVGVGSHEVMHLVLGLNGLRDLAEADSNVLGAR